MNLLQIVMAHAGAQNCFERHEPYWAAVGEYRVYTPADNRVTSKHATVIPFGIQESHGAVIIDRWKNVLGDLCVEKKYTHFLLHEYDSLLLDPERIYELSGEMGGFGRCCVVSNEQPNTEPERFKASVYFHFPILMDREAVWNMHTHARRLSSAAEEGYIDRWLARVAKESGTLHQSWGKFGFSRNTIDLPKYVAAAKEAVENGAFAIHGIKTPEILDLLVSTYRNRGVKA